MAATVDGWLSVAMGPCQEMHQAPRKVDQKYSALIRSVVTTGLEISRIEIPRDLAKSEQGFLSVILNFPAFSK